MTTWADHLYSPEKLGIVDSSDLGRLFNQLVVEQQTRWQKLQEGMAAWAGAKRRRLLLDEENGCYVELLCNPARFSNVTIIPGQPRVCPLCVDNLPSQEMGLSIGSSLIALPNPAPIIKDHVVISHREHNQQVLTPHLEETLILLAESRGDVAILYNGPSSGASTPDHLHFQAGSSTDLPLLSHVSKLKSLRVIQHECVTVRPIECAGRRFLLLLSSDPDVLASTLLRIINPTDREQEMELNLVMWKQASDLAVGLFPRSAHRPSAFYRSGRDQILVSPGSMEMAGLVVVPRPVDWARLTAGEMREIYREVCLPDVAWERLLADLGKQLA